MASLTTGRLNISTHLSLAPSLDDDEQREASYREMTHTVRCEELKEMPGTLRTPSLINAEFEDTDSGICAYAQVAVWQAGDVDLVQLDDQLRHVVQLASLFCDILVFFVTVSVLSEL